MPVSQPAATAPIGDNAVTFAWRAALGAFDEDLRRRAVAPKTRIAYASDTAQFARWAGAHELAPAAIDMRALRTVSRMFDRERLVTGAKGHQGRSILSASSIATASGRLIFRRHASIRR